LNTDLSVAPEIAQLAAPYLAVVRPGPALPGTGSSPAGRATTSQRNASLTVASPTVGSTAAGLADLAAAPQRWWDLVRFDPDGPVRIPVPDEPGTWLLVMPPGAAVDCDCRQATALAGEAAETGPEQAGAEGTATRPLRPGRVRVHGVPAARTRPAHRIHAGSHGYSVTVHWKQ
jgi:hypothetical protein